MICYMQSFFGERDLANSMFVISFLTRSETRRSLAVHVGASWDYAAYSTKCTVMFPTL